MISVSNRNVKFLTKVGLLLSLIYVIGFLVIKGATYYKTSYQKETYVKELKEKKAHLLSLKKQVKILKEKTKNVEESYITKEQLQSKVSEVFARYSLLDYELKYLDAKEMCIDRHVLVVQLVAQSDQGLKAGEGILSFLGETKKSESNDTIYFVDYISKAKDK